MQYLRLIADKLAFNYPSVAQMMCGLQDPLTDKDIISGSLDVRQTAENQIG